MKTLKERSEAKVKKTDACWLWTGATDRKGYGTISSGNKDRTTHRVSWEIYNGPIPAGLNVLHRCDNPPCVNPARLFLGTLKDNTQDALAKNRIKTGSASKRAKLTFDQLVKIAVFRNSGASQLEIAKAFGVCQPQISDLLNGKSYKSEFAKAKAEAAKPPSLAAA